MNRTISLLLIAATSLSACSVLVDTTPFFYNTSNADVALVLDDAVESINEAAGCELVAATDNLEFSTPIRVVTEHPSSDEESITLGCADIGSAHYKVEDMYGITLSAYALNEDIGWGKNIVIHEILHTLGLGHLPGADEGIMAAVLTDDQSVFNEQTIEALQEMCW